MRIKLLRLLSLLLLSPAAGCEREDRAAAPRGIGAEEIVAAFADAYGADLPIAIREGTWDYIAEPDLAAAVKVFAEATFVNRRAPRPEGLTREEYQALLRERVRHNAAIPQRTLYFQKAPPGEIRVAARHEDCYDGPWGMEGDMLVADVSPASAGGWVLGPVRLVHPPGHPDEAAGLYGVPGERDPPPGVARVDQYGTVLRKWSECISRLRREIEEGRR